MREGFWSYYIVSMTIVIGLVLGSSSFVEPYGWIALFPTLLLLGEVVDEAQKSSLKNSC